MMISKVFELRDRATFIPIIATLLWLTNDEPRSSHYLPRRAGYATNTKYILLASLHGNGRMQHDPFAWCDRTYTTAHSFIEANWETLRDGDVIDVEHILGETTVKKLSERCLVGGGL